jgi:hypothetical protein
MIEPRPHASKLLARVGAAGRENVLPEAAPPALLPFHLEAEPHLWLRSLREFREQAKREGFRKLEGTFRRLADELTALVTSLEAFAETLRQAPAPDEPTPDASDPAG